MQDFKNAKPFPHVVLTDLIPRQTLLDAVAEWPVGGSGWDRYRNQKFAMSDLRVMPGKLFEFVVDMMTPSFRRRLTEITGIADLQHDPDLNGAGLHEVRSGGKLDMHVDFNRLGTLYRRLNLLIYLNPVWEEAWGGCLYLGKEREVKVVPTLGTAVLFETSNHSWHGHPDPIVGPYPRRSIALYYYTAEKPDGYVEDLETTRYEKGEKP